MLITVHILMFWYRRERDLRKIYSIVQMTQVQIYLGILSLSPLINQQYISVWHTSRTHGCTSCTSCNTIDEQSTTTILSMSNAQTHNQKSIFKH